MLTFHPDTVIRNFLSLEVTFHQPGTRSHCRTTVIYDHFSSIGTRTSSACFTVFDNVPLWYVREEEILSSTLTPCCPLTGFFFALFMVTTAIAYHNASESTRQQRMKVIPVSLAMFLLATLVRHPSLASTSVSFQHHFLLVYRCRLDPSSVWICRSNGRE
jgi:hypothetical protein